MILSVRVNNFMFYSDEIELVMTPEISINRFEDNICHEGDFKALKSACLYGPNNSGKTCLVRAIKYIQSVLLNDVVGLKFYAFHNGVLNYNPGMLCNHFTGSNVLSLGVSFVYDNRAFSYDFKYDSTVINGVARGYVYECLNELERACDGLKVKNEIFKVDADNKKYSFCGDQDSQAVKDLKKVLAGKSGDNIFIYSVNPELYPMVNEYRNILRDFAESLEIIDSDNISSNKTICALKNNGPDKNKIVELIKQADLNIDDFYYKKPNSNDLLSNGVPGNVSMSGCDSELSDFTDGLGLISVHHGRKDYSIIIDSAGTSKTIALASYIVDALENGKTLVIDELDSGLHFKLTRSIVLLFNNIANNNAQLIFSTHDITLLDCKKIFRQDQIWFTGIDKDNNAVYFYSFADLGFTDKMIIEGCDLENMYRWGEIGVIPEPDLLSIILPDKKSEERDES
ncbi:MAG: ATP-binding protein [Clostridia bacterium]|nr:ATP-binding protein [Clostridia bacterium]